MPETFPVLTKIGKRGPNCVCILGPQTSMGHLEGAVGQACCGGSTVSLVAIQLLASRVTRYGVWAGRFCQHSASSSVALKAAPFLTVLSPRSSFLAPLPCSWQGYLHLGGQFFVLLSELFPEFCAHMCVFSLPTLLPGASLRHSFSLFLFN